jgi:hypothetical protein
VAYDPSGGFPTLAEIRTWIKTSATVLPDVELEKIAGAEQESIAAGYVWPDGSLPDKLYGVFMRLVARHAAARGVTLGILAADAEYGTVTLSRWDSEITRMGGAYRLRTFA